MAPPPPSAPPPAGPPPGGLANLVAEVRASSADDPARAAWAGLVAVFTSGAHQQRFLDTAASLELTPAALKALLSLEAPDPQPMRSLAGTWHCDASNVTQLVDALEGPGYVERRPSPSDRRVKLVAVTDAGQAARRQAIDSLQTPPPVLDTLSRAELEQLADLLGRLADRLHDHATPGCPGHPA